MPPLGLLVIVAQDPGGFGQEARERVKQGTAEAPGSCSGIVAGEGLGHLPELPDAQRGLCGEMCPRKEKGRF